MTTWVLLVARSGPGQQWICEKLESDGYAVETAYSVEEAAQSLSVMEPSVILVEKDLLLDERGGLGALIHPCSSSRLWWPDDTQECGGRTVHR